MFVLKEMFFISWDFFFTMDKFATIWEDLNFFELHFSRNDKQRYFIE